MMKAEDVKNIILDMDSVEQKLHFDKIAFIVNKKIFATLSAEKQLLNVMLSPDKQFILCPPGSDVIFPIDNAWGRRGATTINLIKANKKIVRRALQEAYERRKKK